MDVRDRPIFRCQLSVSECSGCGFANDRVLPAMKPLTFIILPEGTTAKPYTLPHYIFTVLESAIQILNAAN
jgi:hypothetical protein